MSLVIENPDGREVITELCCIENFNPQPSIKSMGMEVISRRTHVNFYETYGM